MGRVVLRRCKIGTMTATRSSYQKDKLYPVVIRAVHEILLESEVVRPVDDS